MCLCSTLDNQNSMKLVVAVTHGVLEVAASDWEF